MADSQSDDKKTAAPDSVGEAMWKFWAQWLTRAAKAAVLFGSGLALLYFYRIQHVPLDSLSGLAGLSTAVAFISLGALGTMGALWGIPSFLFQVGQEQFSAQALGLFRKPVVPSDVGPEWPVISRAKVLTWSFATIGLPWFALLSYFGAEYFAGASLAWTMPAISLICAITMVLRLALVATEQEGIEKRAGFAFAVSTAAFVYVVFSAAALLAFVPIAASSGLSSGGFLLTLLLCIVSAVTLNALAVGMSFLSRRVSKEVREGALLLQALAAVCMLLVLISLVGAWRAAHDWVMVRASIRVPDARLVLNKAGCDALPVNLQEPNPSGARAGSDMCELKGVLILSAVGARWPIQVPWAGTEVYVILSDHVQALQRKGEAPANASKAASAP